MPRLTTAAGKQAHQFFLCIGISPIMEIATRFLLNLAGARVSSPKSLPQFAKVMPLQAKRHMLLAPKRLW
jgi:hypothetical protein